MMYCITCGAQNSDQDKFCSRCGKPLATGAAAQVAAAASLAPPAPTTAYRQGNRLVVPKGAPLPPYCVKCGQPVTGDFLKKKFRWHSPWLYLLIIPGLLVYAIVATILMKYAEVMVPLCDEHRQRRRNLLIAAWVLALGFIPGGILVGTLIPGDAGVGWGFLASFLLFVAAIVAASLSNIMRPGEITDVSSTFTGACEQFLAHLPSR